ncbi:hypothetical protein BT63DRAFT_237132 [Microthyrium microscopicum]|uniref:Uncharacterized protein n=1 Tax=Microthyrium microscopicum TaxID=703497 RepID=A0A6A6UHP0_9PEZI|nr:hypothetical protein BT63DRAFT_237132 [Microthyrium microscopicum]
MVCPMSGSCTVSTISNGSASKRSSSRKTLTYTITTALRAASLTKYQATNMQGFKGLDTDVTFKIPSSVHLPTREPVLVVPVHAPCPGPPSCKSTSSCILTNQRVPISRTCTPPQAHEVILFRAAHLEPSFLLPRYGQSFKLCLQELAVLPCLHATMLAWPVGTYNK